MKITASILSLIAAVSAVSAAKFHLPIHSQAERVVPGAYIVQYENGVAHDSFHNALNNKKVNYKVRAEYNIFNGAAIQVNSPHTGEQIANLPGVKAVWPVVKYSIPKVIVDQGDMARPALISAHNMTGVTVLHDKYKYTGKGVKVGIIDTGIDYNHPALGGCFGKKCRVRYGWDFVGDDYTGANAPVPDADPHDNCNGHGSHVAGIIGANALHIKGPNAPAQPFVGVAPEVTYGAYRIFGCKGSANNDVIMLAMELAFNEGMDVINMSLGGGSAYKTNPEAVLADSLVAKGMAVVAAAGNDGGDGVWMVSDTGLGDLSTSVASFDNIAGSYFTFTYNKKTYPYGASEAWNKVINLPASATLVPVFEANGALSDGCDPAIYKNLNVKGKVVLTLGDVTRCKSGGRGTNALAAGAAGILIQTTPIGIASLGGNANFPMGAIEFYAGNELIAAYKANPNNAITWSKDKTTVRVEGGGAPSDFSSWGFDGDLRQKPDVAAPGGNILSTYPLALGGYAVLSGTSMATPYVAGSHALYIQAKNKKPSGNALRDIFKNTAVNSHFANKESFVPTIKQGAGLINVLNAIETVTSAQPAKFDLLDTVNFVKSYTLTLKNNGKKTETYTLSHEASDSAVSYNGTNSWPFPAPLLKEDHATVTFDLKTVTIKAGKSAKIHVSFKEPTTGDAKTFPMYSGFVVATPATKGGVAVHVPYAGLKGDVSRVPIMDTDFGAPALLMANSTGDLVDVPPNHKFDLTKENPVIITRLASHTPDATIQVFSAKKFVGYLYTDATGPAFGASGRVTNVDETTGATVYTTWTWKGQIFAAKNTTTPTTLPSGSYDVVVASQRKFTKGAYPKDFEIFDLGNIAF